MSDDITEAVRGRYGTVATSNLSSEDEGVHAVAEAFGYSAEELASIPADANMGLSCGNPIAMASLRPGEVAVDLGSGGGLDVFLAAQKVGPTGKAIGIDMTPEMIARAQRNAKAQVATGGGDNIEFILGRIDDLPLPDASVDCVISNCVINLAPDKTRVFKEIVRVLKPGGRLAASDIALKKPLPHELKDDIAAYTGCISGAIPIDDYRQKLLDAGFAEVRVFDSGADLNAYAKVENQSACCSPAMSPEQATSPQASTPSVAACCGSSEKSAKGADVETLHARLADLLRRYDVNDYAASVKVFAVKPAPEQ